MGISKREQSNGMAYTLEGTAILFRWNGDLTPLLVFGDSLVPVDYPERFGYWFTRPQREDWIRGFVKASKGGS